MAVLATLKIEAEVYKLCPSQCKYQIKGDSNKSQQSTNPCACKNSSCYVLVLRKYQTNHLHFLNTIYVPLTLYFTLAYQIGTKRELISFCCIILITQTFLTP